MSAIAIFRQLRIWPLLCVGTAHQYVTYFIDRTHPFRVALIRLSPRAFPKSTSHDLHTP
jgi:hypothetical protein